MFPVVRVDLTHVYYTPKPEPVATEEQVSASDGPPTFDQLAQFATPLYEQTYNSSEDIFDGLFDDLRDHQVQVTITPTQSGGPWTPLEPDQGEWAVLSDNRSGWVPLPPEQGNLTPHQEWEQRRDAFINQYFSGRTLTPELLEIVNASVGPEPEQ